MPWILGMITSLAIVILLTIALCRSHVGRILEIAIAIACHLFNQGHHGNILEISNNYTIDNTPFTIAYVETILDVFVSILPFVGIVLFVIELISIINIAMPYFPKPARLAITIIGILLVAVISFATVQLVGIVPVGYAIASALKSWGNDNNK